MKRWSEFFNLWHIESREYFLFQVSFAVKWHFMELRFEMERVSCLHAPSLEAALGNLERFLVSYLCTWDNLCDVKASCVVIYCNTKRLFNARVNFHAVNYITSNKLYKCRALVCGVKTTPTMPEFVCMDYKPCQKCHTTCKWCRPCQEWMYMSYKPR